MHYESPGIDGWMTDDELEWLFERSREVRTVVEIGCYMGRSTHALLCGGSHVWAVDHFRGTAGEAVHMEAAKNDGIYRAFLKNVEGFRNLSIIRRPSALASGAFRDKAFDMVFIDADHRYEQVKGDIVLWRSKASRLLCGHDFSPAWPGVIQAVRETVTEFQVHGSIWYTQIEN
jgi:predicted O-methyltransferase YrrM